MSRILLLITCAILFGCQAMPAPMPADATAPVVRLTSNVRRQAQPGDSWEYVFTDRFTSKDATAFTEWSGSYRDFVTAAPTNASCSATHILNESGSQSVTDGLGVGQTQTISRQFLSRREAGGTSLQVGISEAGSTVCVTTPKGGSPVFAGPYFVGSSFSTGDVAYDDGTILNGSYVVTQIETVSVPAGTFETYRVAFTATTRTSLGTHVESGTAWLVPSIGQIKMTFTADTFLNSGQPATEIYTEELKSTSIPYSAS